MVTRTELENLVDAQQINNEITNVISNSLRTPRELLSFIHRYVSWNGYFGSGVATLAGKIGRSRSVFVDREEPFFAVADRSVLVASFVFDAARDEFDHKSTPWRDTHRCLAQAFLKGSHQFFSSENNIDQKIFALPFWLKGLNTRVAQGYGARTPDDALHIFHAMGYHLGSELLADKEFSLIDALLSERFPTLISYLHERSFSVGDEQHNGYTWLRTHSGHGDAVEADHFKYAMRGIEFAYRYLEPEKEEEMDYHLKEGFLLFARDHHEFFTRVQNGIQI